MKTAERKPRKPRPASILTARGARFAELVAKGKSKAAAYRTAFDKPAVADQEAANRGYRISLTPAVAARIRELSVKSEAKTLLSLNERLGILASIAQAKKARNNERTRAIDVYSKIAGDGVGETLNVKAELSGPEGGPIPIAGTISVTDKIAKFRAARAGRST